MNNIYNRSFLQAYQPEYRPVMILAFPSPSQLIYISKPDLLFGDLFYIKWNKWGFDFETKSSIFGNA